MQAQANQTTLSIESNLLGTDGTWVAGAQATSNGSVINPFG